MTSRSYVFTAFTKPVIDDAVLVDKVRYIIFQEEKCPKTNKNHWQGYIELKTPLRIKCVQLLLNLSNAHMEKRKGTRDEAREYCRKSESRVCEPIEWGVWESGGQGTRNDIDNLLKMVSENASLKEIIESDPKTYSKCRNTIKDYQFCCLKEKTKEYRKIEVEVIYGAAGTGKTRYCVENSKDYYKLDNDTTLWWDGYEGEETLIIDDFYGDIRYDKLLQILEGYQLRLPVKGGFTYANWKKVFITSNTAPNNWYIDGLTPALKRRLHIIRELRHEVGGNTNPDF